MVVGVVSYVTWPVRTVVSGLGELIDRIKQAAMRALDCVRGWIWGQVETPCKKRTARAVNFYCAAVLSAVKILREGNIPNSSLAISIAKTQLDRAVTFDRFLKQRGMLCVEYRPLDKTSRIAGTITEAENLELQAQLEGQIAAVRESPNGLGFVLRMQGNSFSVGYSSANRIWYLWEIADCHEPIPEPLFFEDVRLLKTHILERTPALASYRFLQFKTLGR